MRTAEVKILVCVLIGASGCVSAPPVSQAAPEKPCAVIEVANGEVDDALTSECCFTISKFENASDSEDDLHQLIIPFVPGYREKRLRERLLRDRNRCLEPAASAPK